MKPPTWQTGTLRHPRALSQGVWLPLNNEWIPECTLACWKHICLLAIWTWHRHPPHIQMASYPHDSITGPALHWGISSCWGASGTAAIQKSSRYWIYMTCNLMFHSFRSEALSFGLLKANHFTLLGNLKLQILMQPLCLQKWYDAYTTCLICWLPGLLQVFLKSTGAKYALKIVDKYLIVKHKQVGSQNTLLKFQGTCFKQQGRKAAFTLDCRYLANDDQSPMRLYESPPHDLTQPSGGATGQNAAVQIASCGFQILGETGSTTEGFVGRGCETRAFSSCGVESSRHCPPWLYFSGSIFALFRAGMLPKWWVFLCLVASCLWAPFL